MVILSAKDTEPGVLLPFGYGIPGSVQWLEEMMQDERALLIDIRFHPWSDNSEWRQEALQAKYGERYRFAGKFLGNTTHREGSIRLANPSVGIRRLVQYIKEGYHLILLCGCGNYTTCHRKVIVELVLQQMPTVQITFPRRDVPTDALLALSVRQPYAYWLTHPEVFQNAGIPPKLIENRDIDWTQFYKGESGPFRGSLLLHASKTFESGALPFWCKQWPQLSEHVPLRKYEYELGFLVGFVNLVEVLEESDDPWFLGEYGYQFCDARAFKQPIPFRGQLGLFPVQKHIVQEQLEELSL